jgi:hypothetical protein
VADELRQRLEALLDAKGIQFAWIPKGHGKHRAIEIQRGADVRRIFLPNSPSDHRSIANCVAMVKRALRKSP